MKTHNIEDYVIASPFFDSLLVYRVYSTISYRRLFPNCYRCDPPKIPSDENFLGKNCIPYVRTAPRPKNKDHM